MTDITIQEQHRQAFTRYSPYVENQRLRITEWSSGGYQGEFPLQSIHVQVQEPCKSLSEYYYYLTNESLHDFFKRIDSMFPGFTLGYRFDGNELSLYLTKS